MRRNLKEIDHVNKVVEAKPGIVIHSVFFSNNAIGILRCVDMAGHYGFLLSSGNFHFV